MADALSAETRLAAPVEGARAAAVGVAWAIRVVRTATAIAELHRLGLGEAASPMVRSVMEHAVSMLWLVERRDEAVKAIEYAHRRHQRLLRDSALGHGWDLSDLDGEMATAPLDLAMVKPEEWPRMKAFEQRMTDPTVRSWYPAYRVESGTSHASYLSGAVYVREDGGFQWEGAVPPTSLRATAVFAVIALQALLELVTPPARLLAAVEQSRALLGMASSE
ncbi:MAG: DUF5677 domain-containing protein [Chloroflexota bacterium]|nr:DUF5677 domain-containing protein [Chloroflexota bacterium]